MIFESMKTVRRSTGTEEYNADLYSAKEIHKNYEIRNCLIKGSFQKLGLKKNERFEN